MRSVVRWLVDGERVQTAPAFPTTFAPGPMPLPASPAARRRRFLAGAAAGAAAFLALAVLTPAATIQPATRLDFDAIVARLGIGIEQVELAGHRYTQDTDILDALDLGNVRSQLALDSAAARARIERLPWIASATISRTLPDGLSVRVIERTPTAIWEHEGRELLIDDTGRRLGPAPPGVGVGLRRLRGLGAPAAAAGLEQLLAPLPALRSRVTLAERIGDRRWRLLLSAGLTVELPADGVEQALALLTDDDTGRRLLALSEAAIDLRVPGRIILRRDRAAATGGRLPSMSIE